MESGKCDKCNKYTIVFKWKYWFLCDDCCAEFEKNSDGKS